MKIFFILLISLFVSFKAKAEKHHECTSYTDTAYESSDAAVALMNQLIDQGNVILESYFSKKCYGVRRIYCGVAHCFIFDKKRSSAVKTYCELRTQARTFLNPRRIIRNLIEEVSYSAVGHSREAALSKVINNCSRDWSSLGCSIEEDIECYKY